MLHVAASQGQPFACVHFSTSICPLIAATSQVFARHGQFRERAHFRTSKRPK
jgi:hypothetical protein